MPDIAKLTYLVGPNLVYCTRTHSEIIVNLTISASNTTDEDIAITGIAVTVPKGTGANDLTDDSMSPVSWQESTWKFKVQGDYFRITPVAPVTALKARESITFQLKNIKINAEPGTAVIEITEMSGDDNNVVFFPVSKIKSSLNVDELNINPPEVKSGDPVIITWQTTAAARVVLSPGDFPDLQVNGSKSLNPELTTTYTLTAKGEGPDITKQVTVTVPPPAIIKFEPSAHEINAGDTVRLSWEVKNAGTITLSPGHEHESLPATGTIDVKPDGDTVYIITAKNKALQTVDKHETVKIKPVVIKKFTATPNSSVLPGDTIELGWETESATSAYILPDGINVNKEQLGNGKIQVKVTKNTDYVLTAQNSNGTKILTAMAALLQKGWHTITTQAPFNFSAARFTPLVLSYRGKMWVIHSKFGIVYNSPNGRDWEKLSGIVQWPLRDEAYCTVFNNKMWIIGGSDWNNSTIYFKDAWSSEDGATWIKVADNLPWGERSSSTCFTLGNKMFISGGMKIGLGFKNDVWSTTDGSNWIMETDNAFKSPMVRHKTVILNNTAWTLGDSGRYEVYTSTDGKTWDLQTAKLSWEGLKNYNIACCSTSNGIYMAFNDMSDFQLQVHKMSTDGVWNKIYIPAHMQTTHALWLEFRDLPWNFAGTSNYVTNHNVIALIY